MTKKTKINEDWCHPKNSRFIDLDEPCEVSYWLRKFGCNEAQLRSAVLAAGTDSINVEAHFGL